MTATAADRQAAIDLLVEDGTIERAEDGEVLTEAQVDKAMAVDNWINDLGGFDDAAIVVYQVDPTSNKMEYIESMGVQEMTGPMLFEKLKNVYGGGKFRIQMRADGAIRKTQTVLIKKVPVKETDATGIGIDLPSLVRELKTGQSGGGIEPILQMMQAQNAQFQTMFTTLVTSMGNNNAPAFDPMAMQASMLEGIQKMQQLAGVNTKEKSATDLIMEGVKLVGAIKEGGESGDANIYSLLSKAVDGFGDTLGAAMRMPPGAGMPGMTAMPGPGQATLPAQTSLAQIANESATAKIVPGEKPVLGQPTLPQGHPLAPFEPFVDWMLGLAQKNANPELYAEVIIDQIGTEAAQSWLATEEGINALKENLPKVIPHENWLRSVGREIALIIEENEKFDSEAERTADGYPGVDESDAAVENAGEASPRISDVSEGHDSPESTNAITIDADADAPHVDGDSQRPGRDSGDAAIDGELSESSQDDAVNT